jgi:hypothetical protein
MRYSQPARLKSPWGILWALCFWITGATAQESVLQREGTAAASAAAGSAFIFGIVTDSAGRPQSGATIRLHHADEVIATVDTDEAGAYRISVNTVGGSYDLDARRQDQNEWKLEFRLQAGEQRGLDLELKPGNRLSGTVQALDDSPLRNVVVQLVRETGPQAGGPHVISRLSDAKGRFEFSHVKPGAYQVRLHTPDEFVYFPQTVRLDAHGTISNINFRLPPFKKGTWRTFGNHDGLAGLACARFTARDGVLWIGTAAVSPRLTETRSAALRRKVCRKQHRWFG